MEGVEKQENTGINDSGNESNGPLKRLIVSSIIGDSVFNLKGESLGKIMDMMIDIEGGSIAYVIIRFGGFFRVNKKYFAVPFTALSIDHEHRHAFILDETRKSLRQFAGFDQYRWPGTNPQFTRSRFSNYGSFMGANTGSEY